MMTPVQADVEEDKLKIPLDLSEWCDKGALLRWIQEEVETLDWSNPELLAYLQAHPGYRPKLMLCLLTLAYATGTFESDEIVRLGYAHEAFSSMTAGADL